MDENRINKKHRGAITTNNAPVLIPQRQLQSLKPKTAITNGSIQVIAMHSFIVNNKGEKKATYQ